ncbi:MAG: hypothetical protein ACI9T7_002425 [Oleiphilaceae bacterium]
MDDKKEVVHKKIHAIEDLKQLQEAFYDGIFDPNSNNIEQASAYILDTEQILEADRLSIYRGSILGGITTALTNIYPVCVKLVGEKYFIHMVAGYLKNYPSNSPDIGNYGEYLPAYIADFEPAKELIYLADVAQLEWLWHRAFNAGNDQAASQNIRPLTELQNLQEHELPSIKFCPVSSANLLSSPYPIHRIWQVNQADFNDEGSVNLDDGDVDLVIWRDTDLEIRIDDISEDETTFISAVLNNASFGEIAELTFSQGLDMIVQRCIQAGFIIGFR